MCPIRNRTSTPSAARREQPLFGGAAAKSDKVRTAALGANDDGSISLDIGRVSGLGVGSEFTATAPNSAGQTVQLRITSLDGIARSSAQIVSPAGAKVSPGDLFELSKWIPADNPPLLVWLWPSNLSQDQIAAAAAQVQVSGAALVSDPAEQQWTHVLSWDGTNWTIQTGRLGRFPVNLGAPLTADAIKKNLDATAKLWVNLPPSQELAAKLKPTGSDSAVQIAGNLSLRALCPHRRAHCRRSRLRLVPQERTRRRTAVAQCAATQSRLLSHVAISRAHRLGARRLRFCDRCRRRQARITTHRCSPKCMAGFSWSTAPPTRRPMSSSRLHFSLPRDNRHFQPIRPRTRAISSKWLSPPQTAIIDHRWVYVLDIDCHGQGTVLYPRDYSENQFPNDADNGRQFVLPGAPILRIGPPYGVDTLIMLSTEQPLADPYVLNFEGVATRGSRGVSSPLEKLFNQTSGGTRGFSGEVPTNWGIGLMTVHSAPQSTTP